LKVKKDSPFGKFFVCNIGSELYPKIFERFFLQVYKILPREKEVGWYFLTALSEPFPLPLKALRRHQVSIAPRYTSP
jgi:hypothetical protein